MSKKIGFVKPNFTQMQSNYVVTDPKDTVEMLQKSGYRVEVINKENMDKPLCCKPLTCIHGL